MSERSLDLEKHPKSKIFFESISKFIDEISGLTHTLPLQIAIIEYQLSNAFKELEKISDDKTEEKSSEDGLTNYKYKIKKGKQRELRKIDRQIKRLKNARRILPRNHVVSMVSQYDAYIGKLIKALFISNPNLIKSSEKEIKPIDLFRVEDIEELKNEIIDKEVDSILRENHIEQLEILERKVSKVTGKDFTLTKNFPVLSDFVELTERRNLFVHTDGEVSRQYISMQKKWEFKTEEEIELGKALNSNKKYIEKVYKVLVEVGVKVGHVLWRKFLPEDRLVADVNLNAICYDMLQDEEFELAQILTKFGTQTIKKHSSEANRKLLVVNRALSFKLNNQDKECQKVVDNEDWSIGLQFKLVKNVLTDNFDEASKIMLEIGRGSKLVEKEDYKDWPLFYKFRETKLFLNTYKEIFKEEFQLSESQEKELVNKMNESKPISLKDDEE